MFGKGRIGVSITYSEKKKLISRFQCRVVERSMIHCHTVASPSYGGVQRVAFICPEIFECCQGALKCKETLCEKYER